MKKKEKKRMEKEIRERIGKNTGEIITICISYLVYFANNGTDKFLNFFQFPLKAIFFLFTNRAYLYS